MKEKHITEDLLQELEDFLDENYTGIRVEDSSKMMTPDEIAALFSSQEETKNADEKERPSVSRIEFNENEEPVLQDEQVADESDFMDLCDSMILDLEASAEDEDLFIIGESFHDMLFRLINEKSLKDSDVYNKAGIDRRLFSKIRNNEDYRPAKKTIMALALAMCLNEDETTDLLMSAGFAFSPASRSDLIIQFCIRNGISDIFEVDELLDKYHEETFF